ncbi:MAG: hypothetical protein ABIZ72_00705 [Candidatus Limnocylindrales bacterium]
MATATARRRRAIDHLVATDHARAHFVRAAFEAVVEGLDLGPIALRTATDRAWARDAIAGPIQEAADRALEALIEGLIAALGEGDPTLVGRMLGHAPDAEPPLVVRVPWAIPRAAAVASAQPSGSGRPTDAAGSATWVAVLR